MHNDHCGSLSQFILYNWFVNKKKTTIISKCEKIAKYLEITGTTKDSYIIVDKYPNIEFIKTEHVKELDAYGFMMNINEKKIVYTGDTSTLNPFIPYLQGCDEFYIDVSKKGGVHLKFEDIMSDLKELKNNGTNIFLMHIDDKEYIRKLNNNEFFI